ncbi:MAG: hypothetical protein ACR2PO_00365 [Methyloligellaceae bacterium]
MAIRNLRGLSARAAVTPVVHPGAARSRRKDPSGTTSDAKADGADAGSEGKSVRRTLDSGGHAKRTAQPEEGGTDISV